MALFGLMSAMAPSPVTDRFVSLSIGGTLVLKACGFIEAQHAEILDVSEDFLRVRIGRPWHERLLGSGGARPIEISLKIQAVTPDDQLSAGRPRMSQTSYCSIEAEIRPAALGWSHEQFQDAARRLVWALRSHFLAS